MARSDRNPFLEDNVRFPTGANAFPSFREALDHYILPGAIPETPPLSRADIVMTQGSCFAEHVADALTGAGVRSIYLPMLEFLNSPLGNRVYLDYVLSGRPFTSADHEMTFKPGALAKAREAVGQASAFIFTCGVAFCPFVDGEIIFRGKDQASREKGIKWRLTTVTENQDHLEAMIAMLRALNPSLKIILTVSPIPLLRAFTAKSVFAADCLSKSVLRAAVGQLMEKNLNDVSYWPSFEALRWLSGHMGPIFGVEGADQRHPGDSFLAEIMDAFVKAFVRP
jgi:hypothetical protein